MQPYIPLTTSLSKKIHLFSIDDRDIPLVSEHNNNIKEYCALHSYTYTFLNTYRSKYNLPCYWWKFECILEYMETRPDIDLIVWLDTDAFIMNPNISFESIYIQDPNKTLFISKEINYTYQNIYNTGIWMIQNSTIGKQILRDCIITFLTHPKCKGELNGPWGKLCYEQGMINEKIKSTYSNDVLVIPSSLFFNTNIALKYPNKVFIYHYFIRDKQKVLLYFLNKNGIQ